MLFKALFILASSSSGRLFPMFYLNLAQNSFLQHPVQLFGQNNHHTFFRMSFHPKLCFWVPFWRNIIPFTMVKKIVTAHFRFQAVLLIYLQRCSLIGYTQWVVLPFVLFVFRTFNKILICKFNFVFLFKLYVPKSFLAYERR